LERERTMRTADEYRASLRDGRVVYYEGQRVRDVTAHPALRVAVDHAALDYEMAADPRHRALAVVPRPGGGEMSRYFAIPRTAEGGRASRRTRITTCGWSRSAPTASSSAGRRCTPRSP